MKRFGVLVLLLALLTSLVSGCSINKAVDEHEVGLFLNKGTEITGVLPAGRHSAWGYFDKVVAVGVSALTVQWADPDLVTQDKQPVGLSVQVTFARDKTKVESMWREYHTEAVSDEALMNQVLGRIPRVAKAVTTQFTLDEMLGVSDDGTEASASFGRYAVQEKIDKLLEAELSEIYCLLLDIGINDIAPDQGYLDLLKRKANAQVGVEVAKADRELAEEQVQTEEALTAIQLEIAKRDRLVAQERAKVYETNPGWLQLKIWEAAKDVFSGDTVWFIDPNADLTLLFTGENIVPYGSGR